MFGQRGALRLSLVVLGWLCAGPWGALAEPVVSGVRTGQHATMTRFVLDISEEVDYRIFTLPNPYRVVIDLPAIDWRVAPGPPRPVGLIRNQRYGRFTASVSRVVLDLAAPVEIHRVFQLPPQGDLPYRFVVDLRAVDEQTFLKRARLTAPPMAAPTATVPEPGSRRRQDGKLVVVIDPGHGGVDPGTIGASGTFEKRVTLAVARELKAALTASGRYHAVLTRERDVFVRLRDRLDKARGAGAVLFISLHADSIKNRRLRGASVYTLSEQASDKEAADLAARENKADIIAGVDFNGQSDEVTSILIDLAQRETMNQSARFANMLLPEIAKAGKLLRKSHRFAGFAVLKAPDVPSVLVEMGYLSNPDDERFLTSAGRRKPLVSAIVRAIDSYFAVREG